MSTKSGILRLSDVKMKSIRDSPANISNSEEDWVNMRIRWVRSNYKLKD